MSKCPHCQNEAGPRCLKVAYVEMCPACMTTWPSNEDVTEYMKNFQAAARLDAAKRLLEWLALNHVVINTMDDAALARIVAPKEGE